MKCVKAMLRDEWTITDAEERAIGIVREVSPVLALLRRIPFLLWIPRRLVIEVNGTPACEIRRRTGLPLRTVSVHFLTEHMQSLDKRIGIAVGVLVFAS